MDFPDNFSWWPTGRASVPQDWAALYQRCVDADVDEVGMHAASFIARTRKRTGAGPTFRATLAELGLSPTEVAERPPEFSNAEMHRIARDVGHQIMSAMNRAGWIKWEREPRSLQVGRRYRFETRALTRRRRRHQRRD